MGDGVVLSFSEPKSVDVFDVCLRLNTDTSGEYDEMDFGYATDSLQFIYPLGFFSLFSFWGGTQMCYFGTNFFSFLGMKKITTQEDAGIWYCSPFDFQDAPTSEEGVNSIAPYKMILHTSNFTHINK